MACIVGRKSHSLAKSGHLNPVQKGTSRNRMFAFGEQLLSSGWILKICRNSGHQWRQCKWTPVVTFWACIVKQLQGGAGARLLEHLASLQGICNGGAARDGADFCRARLRLPEELFHAALIKLSQCLPPEAAGRWRDLRVVFVDGIVFRAPRTSANQKAFGSARNWMGCTQWPLMRALMLVCSESGMILHALVGGFQDSERSFFRPLIERLDPGFLIVGDRGFCSWMALWYVGKRGGNLLCRLHQTRRREAWQKVGDHDFLSRWSKKTVRFTRCAEWQGLIGQVEHDLWVRIIERTVVRKGYRAQRIALVTTLLDPQKYPADELVKLYLKRWNIECDFRTLKGDYGVTRLTAKTPQAARSEMLSAAVAYSIVCLEKARAGGPQARHLSSRKTLELVLFVSTAASYASTARKQELCEKLTQEIRLAAVAVQERPPEPRLVVHHIRRYKRLTVPRHRWHAQYLKKRA